MYLIVELEEALEKAWLEGIFKRLIDRHESLRTSFEIIEDEPVQRVHEEVEFVIEYYDIGKEGTMGLAPLPSEPAPGNWQRIL